MSAPRGCVECPACDGGREAIGATCSACHGERHLPKSEECRRCGRNQVRAGVCLWCNDRGGYRDDAPPRRSFYVMHESYWWASLDREYVAEIMFGWNVPGGGTLGEMALRWHRQASSSDPTSTSTPRLEVFCDAWLVLERFSDVIHALAEADSLKTRHVLRPEEFVEMLKRLGFVDETVREQPPLERPVVE